MFGLNQRQTEANALRAFSQAFAMFLLSFMLSNDEYYTRMKQKVKPSCVRIVDEFPKFRIKIP